ncbi:cytochrome-c oxidase assembly protein [Tothia fuscella]|uniref:Cytochrome-c oxidase assembly protein n=1 Tax=Tothia fuscella TaxID=1048955 RepID=A0A9P4NXM8_9PEZI|nr:cytochrome-c oxidase assembly protein [Tothia fuscella]
MNRATRIPLSPVFNSKAWICQSCARTRKLPPRNLEIPSRNRRYLTTNTRKAQDVAPDLAEFRQQTSKRNQTLLFYTLSTILATVGLSYGSVPMYKMICQQMGWGGQPIKSVGHFDGSVDPSTRLQPVTTVPRLRITFNSSVSSILPWKFTPQQREVRVLPGETALAFYTATNNSKEDIIGVATYSVSPGQVAPYFSKIQCFCFEEQRLNAGETVDMPVFFYIDPEFVRDPNMKGIETVTLSYTFFKAKYDKDGHLKPVPMSGFGT